MEKGQFSYQIFISDDIVQTFKQFHSFLQVIVFNISWNTSHLKKAKIFWSAIFAKIFLHNWGSVGNLVITGQADDDNQINVEHHSIYHGSRYRVRWKRIERYVATDCNFDSHDLYNKICSKNANSFSLQRSKAATICLLENLQRFLRCVSLRDYL